MKFVPLDVRHTSIKKNYTIMANNEVKKRV